MQIKVQRTSRASSSFHYTSTAPQLSIQLDESEGVWTPFSELGLFTQ